MDKFLFPIDFVAMDVEEDDDALLILGRPFMKTAKMMINIDDGLMKVRVQDEEVFFNLFEAIKHSKDKGDYFIKDVTDEFIVDVQRQVYISTPLEKALTDALKVLNAYEEKEIEECLIELDSLEEIHPFGDKVE